MSRSALAATLALSALLACGLAPAQQRLLPSHPRPRAEFGECIAISGTTAAIAAWRHDARGQDAGAAYVFVETGAGWTEEAFLTASDGAPGDAFGTAVAIAGDRLCVAAFRDDDRGPDSGSAYVFERVAGAWKQAAKLLAGDGAAGDGFGFYCGIHGDTAVVTAHRDDDQGTDSGSAYVFERRDGRWVEAQKLLAEDGQAHDEFGYACALAGERLVITARLADARGKDSGAAYVFEKEAGRWLQTHKLVARDGKAGDQLGNSVSLAGEACLVGAWLADPAGPDSGAAYLFRKEATGWQQAARLVPDDGAAGDHFGGPVGLAADHLVIGAILKDSAGRDSGAVYGFQRGSDGFVQRCRLVPEAPAAGDRFGFHLAVRGGTVLIGAHGDDDQGVDAGSVRAFDLAGERR